MSKYNGLKAGAKEFFIDMYIELYEDAIIDVLVKFLEPIKPEDLRQFVAQGAAPPIPNVAIQRLKDYEDYLEKLSEQELFKWLAKARPDLTDMLVSLGDEGAEYVVKLKRFFIDSIKATKEVPAEEAKPKMVKLHCEACGKDWELPKSEAEQVTKCPYCGVGIDEGAEDQEKD